MLDKLGKRGWQGITYDEGTEIEFLMRRHSGYPVDREPLERLLLPTDLPELQREYDR